jgi:hypothetical protein
VSGERPKTGVRYALERVELTESGVTYKGFVHLPAADLPIEVEVELPSLRVHRVLAEAGKKLETMAGALVRSAVRSALAQGTLPPRRIFRWRPPERRG